MRSAARADKYEQEEGRKRKGDERYAANVRKKSKQAAIRDHAETILTSCLVTSVAELEVQLAARSSASSARCAFLSFIRVLPTLTPEYTNPVASELKAEFAKQIADLAAPQDDPVYVELQGLYVGKILFDLETRSNAKMFRIVAIQFVRSYTAGRCSCWEATCEPVVHDAATGQFRVPNNHQVPGSNVTLTHALQGTAWRNTKRDLTPNLRTYHGCNSTSPTSETRSFPSTRLCYWTRHPKHPWTRHPKHTRTRPP
jgi:hypothetical protein